MLFTLDIYSLMMEAESASETWFNKNARRWREFKKPTCNNNVTPPIALNTRWFKYDRDKL
jgi:hypothetical protein